MNEYECLYVAHLDNLIHAHSKTPVPSINFYKGTVTTQWPDSDGEVTFDNCWQYGDYSVDQMCSHCAAGS